MDYVFKPFLYARSVTNIYTYIQIYVYTLKGRALNINLGVQ